MIEGFNGKIENKLNIRIKTYGTYDIEFIKNNIPNLDDNYDEEINLDYDEVVTFKACDNKCLNSKSILIRIDLTYKSEKASLYKYNFEKIYENRPLQYKSYDINWFINYDFSPISSQSQDYILISTNHSNTIFPYESGRYRKFESYNDGHLLISFPDINLTDSQIKILYSSQDAERKDDKDVGHMEVYKLDNKNISFERIIIDESIQSKLYSFELTKSIDKYFYIQINANDYYILYESEDDYSFLTIEKMPVDIIKFCQSNKKDDIILLTNKNEYLMKLIYTRPIYSLTNMYIIKNEIITEFNLEEGDLRMFTFSSKETEMNIKINILEKEITEKSYINLRIPSNEITGNLYITYLTNTSALNNKGINIYNNGNEAKINLKIQNLDNIKGEIPIILKLGYRPEKIKYISYNNNYEFKKGQYGIIKFKEDKKISMKFKTDLSNIYFNYYTGFLQKDFTIDTTNIINPELFETININTKEYNFEIETKLDLEKINVKTEANNNGQFKSDNDNINIEELYLIFSFNGNAEVSTGDKPEDSGSNTALIVGIVVPIVVIIVAVIVVIIYFRIKRKKNSSISMVGEQLVDKSGSGEIGLSQMKVDNSNIDDKNAKQYANI